MACIGKSAGGLPGQVATSCFGRHVSKQKRPVYVHILREYIYSKKEHRNLPSMMGLAQINERFSRKTHPPGPPRRALRKVHKSPKVFTTKGAALQCQSARIWTNEICRENYLKEDKTQEHKHAS